MGHASYAELLEQLVAARDIHSRTRPDWAEMRLRAIESIMQSMLEKLRDQFDAR